MAPYEYRLCAEPDAREQHAWTVTVWHRHYTADPDQTGWRCVARLLVDGKDWPHDPKQVWPLIFRKLKV